MGTIGSTPAAPSLDEIQNKIEAQFKKASKKNVNLVTWKVKVVKLVRQYLTRYRETVDEFSDLNFQFILGCTTNPLLDDSEQTVNVLQSFFRTDYERFFVFYDITSRSLLASVLRHANQQRFDFWGVRRGVGLLCWEFNPVVDCFTYESLDTYTCTFVDLYLQYGFKYSFYHAVYRQRCTDFVEMRYRYYNHLTPHAWDKLQNKPNKFRMMLILDTFNIFTFDLVHDMLMPLTYVFRSIPEPYVGIKEMIDEMETVVNRDFFSRVTHVANEYSKWRNSQRDYFDQFDSTTKPRPILHLCRCKIRNALAANLALPDGIEAIRISAEVLGVPGTQLEKLPCELRRYLNLER